MFYDNFKKVCLEKRVTESSVCDKAGVSRSLLSKWRSGAEPKIDTIERLAEQLGVSAEYLKGMPDVLPIRVGTINDEEKELLRIYKLLDTKGRTLLLARAYELEETNGKL